MTKAGTTTTWAISAHTAAKHRLLRAYLDQWFPVIASWSPRMVYLDGFAGPGRYENGQEGSPIVALRALLEHRHYPEWTRRRREFTFAFCEPDPERVLNLRTEVDELFAARGGRPGNVTVMIEDQSFVDVGNDLVAHFTENGRSLAPTLAFIDPFGFKGLPMELIGRLLHYDACEVLVNFMLDSVNRFATGANVDDVTMCLAELFASSAYTGAPAAGDPDRGPFLLDLYKRQLTTVGGFHYVRSFEVVNDKNRHLYDLVFGTHHLKGLEAMKEAMWKVDPEHGRRFSSIDAVTPTMFSDIADVQPLRPALLGHFGGQEVAVEEVENYVLEDTDFLPGRHLKTATLKPMEEAGELEVTAGRKRKGTFPAGCRILFS